MVRTRRGRNSGGAGVSAARPPAGAVGAARVQQVVGVAGTTRQRRRAASRRARRRTRPTTPAMGHGSCCACGCLRADSAGSLEWPGRSSEQRIPTTEAAVPEPPRPSPRDQEPISAKYDQFGLLITVVREHPAGRRHVRTAVHCWLLPVVGAPVSVLVALAVRDLGPRRAGLAAAAPLPRDNCPMNRECHQSTEVGVTNQPKHRHPSTEGRKGAINRGTTGVGGPRGARTRNLRIKSPQLCQLS